MPADKERKMRRTSKLILCVALLVMAMAIKAQATPPPTGIMFIGVDQIVPGANCFIHCDSTHWCQAYVDPPELCDSAATACCQNFGGVGDHHYTPTSSPGIGT
jgi:hypothetical protein